MYSYGSPHMAVQKQGDQLERTFSSYVRIQDVVLKTYLGRWTIGRSGERGSGISVLPARDDDDDDNQLSSSFITNNFNFTYFVAVSSIIESCPFSFTFFILSNFMSLSLHTELTRCKILFFNSKTKKKENYTV